ncbi:class I SAM-dependent methyltransferase [Aureivirga marina]|uniref:class I SAM-dependent methyltransferase n=1 Tax=Aureivirga marina TaxID=1182451 RepID=UPI0018CA8C8C|nr:class I SAM-dependent methyltransferase [Aureivirga marina]
MLEKDYNKMARTYDLSHKLPTRKYGEEFTFLKEIGELKNKTLLDLGCGSGYYSFLLQKLGAKRIVGIDISDEMIKVANEKAKLLKLENVEFLVEDLSKFKSEEKFDIVISAFVFNHMKTKEEVLKFCETIYRSLNKDGFYVGCSSNFHHQKYSEDFYKNYGIKITIPEYENGKPVFVKMFVEKEQTIEITNSFLFPKIYEEAFKKVGFSSVEWIKTKISPIGIKKYGKEFWENYQEYPYEIFIKAKK